MRVATEKYRSTDISGHYADFARALGGYGERVEDPSQIRAALGPLNGVLHAAGRMDDAPMQNETVESMDRADYDALSSAGCNDGEILEVNQVCAYFNYSNRLLNGLGVTTEGDVVGYYGETEDRTEAD